MARVKVFQVIECGGPGGSGLQVAALCNALDPARFDVALVFNARPGNDPQEYRELAKGAARAFHVPELTRELSPFSDLRGFFRLLELFRAERPDVVHVHCSKAGFLGRLAAWLADVPRIYYSPRGYNFLMRDRGALSRGLYRLLERSVSWIGDIVAVSPSEAGYARELSGRVHLAPDPYWPDPPPPRAEEGGDVLVGACGRLTYARNPEAFVRLAQQLTDSRNGLRCVWIGDGELGERVREMIRDMNLAQRLELTGWLPPEAARERLAKLDLLVHFSRWEGLPNAVIDAMAAGVPVVASDVPGNRDAVADGETGLIVQDEVDLLEKTLALVDDPGRRRKLGAAGRARVEREFSRRRTFETLERLYAGT